jgi:ABC-type Na+ transport system ATPase subunit NatA
MTLAIETSGLVKDFGTTRAVDEVDLAVPAGSVFGLLGPNGAGKTTTIRMLSTLLRPDAGHATVMGYDVVTEAAAVRTRISLTGQFASLDEDLTGAEFRECDLSRARLVGVVMRDVEIDGLVGEQVAGLRRGVVGIRGGGASWGRGT